MHLRALCAVALAAFIGACTAGSAPSDPIHSIAPDPPYSSQDPPGASGCARCAGNLRCVGTYEGVAIDAVVSSSFNGAGECVLSGGAFEARLRCDGQIVTGGQNPRGGLGETSEGTWSPAGDGVVLCVQGTCIICPPTDEPAPPPPDPQPVPVGGGSGTNSNDAG